MAGLNDTSPEAEEVLREAYRKMSSPRNGDRWVPFITPSKSCTRWASVNAIQPPRKK